jgi:hypothetical protein
MSRVFQAVMWDRQAAIEGHLLLGFLSRLTALTLIDLWSTVFSTHEGQVGKMASGTRAARCIVAWNVLYGRNLGRTQAVSQDCTTLRRLT